MQYINKLIGKVYSEKLNNWHTIRGQRYLLTRVLTQRDWWKPVHNVLHGQHAKHTPRAKAER